MFQTSLLLMKSLNKTEAPIFLSVVCSLFPKAIVYFTGVYIGFHISAQKQIVGIRKNRLAEAVLTSTHNLCLEQKYENYQKFSSESFHFWVVKFSIYLNRRVFVMRNHTTLLF